MLPESGLIDSLFLCILLLWSVQQGYTASVLSNAAFQSSSSTDGVLPDDEWQEVPEPSVSLFDSVRRNSSIPPISNKIVSPTAYTLLGSNDATSLYVMPPNTPMPNTQTNVGLTENEFESLINNVSANKGEDDQDEYIPVNAEQWKPGLPVIWNPPPIGNSNAFSTPQTFSPLPLAQLPPLPLPQTMIFNPVYQPSFPNQDKRNLLLSRYPVVNRPIQPQSPRQRAPWLGPPMSTVQMNRYTAFQPYSSMKRIPSYMLFRRSRSSLERPTSPSNQLQNLLASRDAATLQQSKQFPTLQSTVAQPRTLPYVNSYDRTRRILF
ncbi:unnamed protein product [Heterobilharzia americana]|nr:unnamed protein product [Heterobilharzia americana]